MSKIVILTADLAEAKAVAKHLDVVINETLQYSSSVEARQVSTFAAKLNKAIGKTEGAKQRV